MNQNQTRIIVNADDFGLGTGIDEGILQLAEQGKISSTSVVANGEHFEAGVLALQKRAPQLGTGVHICLDEERPVLTPDQLPTLTNSEGRFHRRSMLIRKLAQRSIDMIEVENEITAQVEKIINSGLKVTHFDGHGHVHVYPWVSDVITRVARKYGITKARMPLDVIRLHQANWQKRPAARALINYWTRVSLRQGFLKTVQTPQDFFGITVGGNLSSESLNMFSIQKGAANEIMVHPGLPTEKEEQKYEHWNYSWRLEYQTLMQEMDAFVTKNAGKLITYGDLEYA